MSMPPAAGITGVDTHAHVFRHDLPMVSGRRYSPEYDAPVEDYLRHLDRYRLSHGVLIQPSFLGTDNSYMLAALRRFPQRLRGVAVVAADVAEAELDELGDAGVVGVRLNLVGKVLEDYLGADWQRLFRRLAKRGWQVEVQRSFADLQHVAPMILDTGAALVIDHFGLPAADLNLTESCHARLFDLLRTAPAWFKVSAAYRSQSDLRRAQALLAGLREAFGGVDRLLWGSDWPHTQFESRIDYDSQVAFLDALLPDAAERQQVLAHNPAALFQFPSAR